ncbi:membrane-bound acid phosphatase 2 [Leishmania infantum JPCM5]|uniref:Membrane-bound_acid_phosphatase_2 n=2 Tax=Leishmania infantum TaxID=5671 RepID=A0A6L0XE10_LEIIN|nr:membrane-bound acid phosphatase 2 [Leishmania infantum JPCM5]CAC9489963.1 membrane-bound_acid_phosphatase_2 [Leishmania infantum]CAM68245.1 membrane-bound acid phosphatase 2 [Leishmania infantum JPCM5]SUZ42021.1 membrane-bound_acid_phosphatase_2 [Leishmania infantum]|eukprot:XP_001465816.1 membrane-bound acid phosphatase 2 [Leishmania infantum JPCM5]
MRQVLFLLLLAALLLCVPAPVTAALDMKLVMVQLMHRHGARTAEPSYNKTQICGDTPCGYLTWSGIEMLSKTGAFLRSRYNTDSSVVSEPMFPSEDYDLDVAYSRSTDVLRTLQSAESFLRGFFPNLTSLYPAIHTVPEQDDYILYTNYVPQFQFYWSLDMAGVRAVCNPVVDRNFPDFNTLTTIAQEVYSEGYCSDFTRRTDCAFTLFDIAVSKEAIGELDNYPKLKTNRDRLSQVAREHFARQYVYNRSDTRCFQQGSSGQPILQEFVKNIGAAMAGTSRYKLYHYSAHDTTLSRIACSLQDTADDGLLPPFAQTLVLELLQSLSDSSYHVRVLRGHTGQSPASGFEFAWEPDWQLKCMSPSGQLYNASGNRCSVADFTRFVQWGAAPAGSMGYCYLDEKYRQLRNCPEGGIEAGDAWQALPSGCQYYRKRCPSYSCDAGYMLDSLSLQCVCIAPSCLPTSSTAAPGLPDGSPHGAANNTLAKPSGLSAGGTAAVAMGTFCIGALLAAFVTAAVLLCCKHRKSPLPFSEV